MKVLQDVKCGVSTFHIRLTYSRVEASIRIQNFVEKIEGCKRRKVGKSYLFMQRLMTLILEINILHLHFIRKKMKFYMALNL